MTLKKKIAVSPTADKIVNKAPIEDKTEAKTEVKTEVKTETETKPAGTLSRKKAAPAPEAEAAPEVIEAKAEAQPEPEPERTLKVVTQDGHPVDTSSGEVIGHPEDAGQLAVPSETALVAAPKTGIIAQAAQGGFEGLNSGFGTFPILKIDSESFELDDEEYPEKEIYMNISQSRAKFIVKQKDQGDEAEFIYSYNALIDGRPNPNALDVSGSSVQAWIDKQHLAGCETEVKEYIEAIAELMDDNKFNGELVLLSIPPSGVRRFTGYCIKLQLKHQCLPDKVITVATIGKKIKKGSISWCPWVFKFAEMMEE